jgi:hypothetical protein
MESCFCQEHRIILHTRSDPYSEVKEPGIYSVVI